MSLGRSLLRNKSLLKLSAKETPQEIIVSFHSSGLTCNQWRKLKNLWAPGKTLFRPSCVGEKKDQFLSQYGQSGGPTCLAVFPKEAANKIESIDEDLLLLYGKYGSTLVDHMDIQKGATLAESESSLFDFCLPSSYLSFLCSPPEKLNDSSPPPEST
ncbi:OLC1v1029889C1 [Oldenlandia corymbosa var. corymbosa]|uniref:OLC1v1029889C1 n=1 Tax=Oldenlandia corymbosa var. corymbosa TaxID=529605 RepID=A0AAV1CFK2_OLDCO|nr:OLC1v1029889C1 [Oldenlandia corymbosa var. corymbosa]